WPKPRSTASCELSIRNRALDRAAGERRAARPVRRSASRDDHLCSPRRPDGGGDLRAHARQRRLARVLYALRARGCGARPDRVAARARRMAQVARPVARSVRAALWRRVGVVRPARGARGVRMKAAALIHRLSGVALALFLPVHFWALGKGLQLDAFLRWTE